MAELLIMQDSYQTSEVLEYFIEEVFSLLDNANTSAAIKMVILELLSLHAGNFIHVSRLKQFLYREKCDKLQACMVMVFDKWMRGDYIDDLALEGLEKFFTEIWGEKWEGSVSNAEEDSFWEQEERDERERRLELEGLSTPMDRSHSLHMGLLTKAAASAICLNT